MDEILYESWFRYTIFLQKQAEEEDKKDRKKLKRKKEKEKERDEIDHLLQSRYASK